MDINKNHFELFELPLSPEVDLSALDSHYRQLLKAVHPDRFADDDQQQRLAAQYAAHINHAYDTLKSPLLRGLYLLELKGAAVDMERNTVMNPAFLMEQMELREALGEVESETELEVIARRINDDVQQYHTEFVQLWQAGSANDLAAAGEVLQKMQFMLKLGAQVELLEERLLDD